MKNKLTLLAVALLPMSVAAEDCACPEEAAAEPKKKSPWSGEIAIGYSKSSGNTNSTLIDSRNKATRDGENWLHLFKLEAQNEYTEDERIKEKYFASAKSEYKLGGASYLFGLAEYTDDRFSGFDYEAAVSFGYGRNLIKNDVQELSADLGLGYRYSEFDEPVDGEDDQDELFARVGIDYLWRISQTAIFEEEFSFEAGEEKNITKSYSRIKLKINSSLFAYVSYDIEHTSDVPPGTKNSDRKTVIGFDYSF